MAKISIEKFQDQINMGVFTPKERQELFLFLMGNIGISTDTDCSDVWCEISDAESKSDEQSIGIAEFMAWM